VQALNLGVIGPCLLDLEALIGLPSGGQLSVVFTVRGLLAICASLLLGPVLDRANRYLLVSIALHVDFALYVAVPHCKSLTSLLATLGPPEFVNCGIGMGQFPRLSVAQHAVLKCVRMISQTANTIILLQS